MVAGLDFTALLTYFAMQIHARRYDTGEPICLTVSGEKIARMEPAWPVGPVADWPFVAPGLFDLQINGHSGIWFCASDLTVPRALSAIKAYSAHGVTRMCPTLVTNSFESLSTGFRTLRQACEQEAWADKMVPGFHLEGPYFSAEEGPRGAHPPEHIRPAKWDEFQRWQEIAGGRIRLVTLAPEAVGAVPFIQAAVKSGVRIAIGHTAANAEQIQAAVDAGAVLSTHLGNGSHGMLRRHPNYIWEQLGEARLAASLITDGHHLPPSVVRSIVRAKGVRQSIITCDASGWAGCAPGLHENELGKVQVLPSGKIVVAGQEQYLAGSGSGTMTCVERALEFTGLSLREAFDMAGSNPARLLGFEDYTLRQNSRADLVVFRDSRAQGAGLVVEATICAGALQFGRVPAVN